MTQKRTKDQDVVNIIIIVIICEDEQKRTMDKKRGNERYAVHTNDHVFIIPRRE